MVMYLINLFMALFMILAAAFILVHLVTRKSDKTDKGCCGGCKSDDDLDS